MGPVDRPWKYVKFSVEEHIAHVRLNRPPVNALSQDLVTELANLARNLQQNEDIWVITLQATGHVFCAGADLK